MGERDEQLIFCEKCKLYHRPGDCRRQKDFSPGNLSFSALKEEQRIVARELERSTGIKLDVDAGDLTIVEVFEEGLRRIKEVKPIEYSKMMDVLRENEHFITTPRGLRLPKDMNILQEMNIQEQRGKEIPISLAEHTTGPISERLEDEWVKVGFQRTIGRVLSKTRVADELRSLGAFDFFTQGLPETGIIKPGADFPEIQVVRGREERSDENETLKQLRESGILGKEKKATYLPLIGLMAINGRWPSQREVWRNLALTGRFVPYNMTAISFIHEMIHAHQWPTSRIEEYRRKYIRGSELLPPTKEELYRQMFGEIQAHRPFWPVGTADRYAAYSLSLPNIVSSSGQEIGFHRFGEILFRETIKRYDFSRLGLEDLNRTIMSEARTIEQLEILGLNEQEIAQLIASAEWDPRTLSFSSIKTERDKRMKERSLKDSDFDRLAIIRDIKTQIGFEMARIIAQEELLRVLAEKDQQK